MLTGKLTSTGDIDKKDFRLMAPRFQEEAFAKVRKPAELVLGLLCCWQQALGFPSKHWTMSVMWMGGLTWARGFLCCWHTAPEPRQPQKADREQSTRPLHGGAHSLQHCFQPCAFPARWDPDLGEHEGVDMVSPWPAA